MNAKEYRRELSVPNLLFAVVGVVGLAAGTWGLLQWGGQAAAVMATQNGEVLMRRAMVFERAGDFARAREGYAAALSGRFAGPQNRAYSQKGLAVAEMALGNHDDARALLEDLRESPYWSTAWYKAYLPLLEAAEERLKLAEAWYRAAENEGHEAERRQALQGLALCYEAVGDLEAAREAFGTLVAERPQSEAAYHLGRLEYDRQEFDRARQLMEHYLASGGGASAFGAEAQAYLDRLESPLSTATDHEEF